MTLFWYNKTCLYWLKWAYHVELFLYLSSKNRENSFIIIYTKDCLSVIASKQAVFTKEFLYMEVGLVRVLYCRLLSLFVKWCRVLFIELHDEVLYQCWINKTDGSCMSLSKVTFSFTLQEHAVLRDKVTSPVILKSWVFQLRRAQSSTYYKQFCYGSF